MLVWQPAMTVTDPMPARLFTANDATGFLFFRPRRWSQLLTLGAMLCCLFTGAAHAQTEVWPNAYANSQAERLLDQGRSTLDAADPETAVRVVSDALQIIRINHGLRSSRQIGPLQLLIAAHLQARDWSAADSQIDYFQWLNASNYRQDFPAYLSGSEALSDLLLSASADPGNPQAVRYLVAAKNLNWRTITAIEAREGKDSRSLVPWLYRVVHNHYQQSALIRRRGLTSYNFHSDADALVSGFRLSKNESLRMSYNIGKELLQRIERLLPSDAESRALIAVHQADWELLYGQYDAATQRYELARQRMHEGGRSAVEIAAFFNRPVIIPELRLQRDWPELSTEQRLSVLAWSPLYPGVAAPLATARAMAGGEPLAASLRISPPGTEAASTVLAALQRPWQLDIDTANPDIRALRQTILQQARLLQFRPMQNASRNWYSLRMELSAHYAADEQLALAIGLNNPDTAAATPE